MMVAGFLCVLTSGVVLLATTTTMLVHQTDGASLSSNDDGTVECPTELAACAADLTCINCLVLEETSSAVFDTCADGVTSAGVETSTAYCFGSMAGVCCLDEASENACLENDAFVEYWLCVLEVRGCSVDEITCDDDGGSVGSSSGATTASLGRASTAAFACAVFVPLLPLLRV